MKRQATRTVPIRAGAPSTGDGGVEQVNVMGLEERLRRHVRGEVRFDAGSRALYATDASNFRQEPIGVVIPRTLADVEATVAACRAYGAPLLPRGCGTSLSGETVNFAVVVDFSKYLHDVEWVDPRRRLARCLPGVVCDDLKAAASRHGLTWGPDPSTHQYCTIGGMLGNNSCGTHSVMAEFYGSGPRTSDNVEELEVMTYDGLRLTVGPTSEEELDRIIGEGGRRGEIYRGLRDLRDRYADLIRERMPDIPRRVSGYNLDELLPEKGCNVARALVGTEGTCVVVLGATLRLLPEPAARATVVLGYDDIVTAAEQCRKVMAHRPLACEAMDDTLIEDLRIEQQHLDELQLLPGGSAWLLVEFGGDDQSEADERVHALLDDLRRSDHRPPTDVRTYDDPARAAAVWHVREGGLGATAFPPDGRDHWPGWEDSAVSPERIGPYLRDLRKLYARHGLRGALYGHFGQGCVHSRISFDLRSAEGIATYRGFLEDAADLVASHGGTLSGEHGDGQQRAELLPRVYGDELVEAFREFKAVWDPGGRMNPGKVVDPYRLDEHLRLGTDYHPPQPATHFSYPDDGGSLAHAALRCVGVGKCRQPHDEGTMCPSFQVLREEKHTTRGRARLFHEMLAGDITTGGWRDHELYEALELCLSCKGCTHECPVHVDIPTLKAEFLAHYYSRRLRPRSAYAMGWIMHTARVASLAPSVANLAGQAPLLSRLVKLAGGVAPERQVPAFAATPFRRWFARHRPAHPAGPPVMLWPDTFNDHFTPQTSIAAVRVLEDAGFRVLLPDRWVCCGRPLYDYGFLGMATRLLRHDLQVLRPALQQGIPVVGLEPSCLAVFRDELPKLLPNDEDGQRLTGLAVQFSEVFARHAPNWRPPRVPGAALVHGHCHHKNGLGGMEAELRLLDRTGLDYTVPDTGCCGMAGSFGFEQGERHRVSVDCGERVLLPAVRDAAPDTFVVTNGFSCREQIRQETERRALHLADVLALALDRPDEDLGPLPERLLPDPAASPWRGAAVVAAAATALTAGGALRRLRP
ncbi:dimethylmenaquinone methyltransferase [Wenjunlia vitaminophila]|uniref:Dimethylmenaquinone methyltransferase n=1 Tax=Wenjunlia vitaminophila TaxID=76728 RepID=A0A0T6LQU9_WENVI|nr:FAD-binding and (Fe-S)-binding domain-containing protein [Wenjunlia vitaminophila]KRV48432.1 dimethylmenaquinone methyltransferase [Wenjunlia vitaminophila]